MKKHLLYLVIIGFITIMLVSCDYIKPNPNGQKDEVNKITIYTVNDFHGALEADNGTGGAARIGQFIIDKRATNPKGTVVLAAGDMFQGTALSNFKFGLDVIEWMNYVDFDAMTIGNHEFDWGIDKVLNYVDGEEENGEAEFPFLGANIIDKRTDDLLEKVEPYTIIERGDVSIGVIGYIGYGLESDIANSNVENFEFISPQTVVAEAAEELRTEHDVDIVVALAHDASSTTNGRIADLTGDQRVDVIINGHTHQEYTNYIDSPDGRDVPIVQAGSSGEYVGIITLELDEDTKEVKNATVTTQNMTRIFPENETIKEMIDDLIEETAPIFQRVIGTAGTEITKYATIPWAANELREYMNADVAFINAGGIRTNAFPIRKDEAVTVAKIYEIMPFDNTVITVEVLGSKLRDLMDAYLNSSTNITKNGSTILFNGKIVNDNETYLVATIDYVFDHNDYPFRYINGQNTNRTGILFRDVLINGVEQVTAAGQKWDPSI